MKTVKIALAAALAFAAVSAQATKIATQEWVLRQLPPPVTVSEEAGRKTYEARVDGAEIGIPEAVALRLAVSAPTNSALRVISSTVPSVPGGTYYALSESGWAFENRTLAELSTITFSITNRVKVSTNILGGVTATTNGVALLRAYGPTGGVWRAAYSHGTYYLFEASAPTNHLRLAPVLISDDAAAALRITGAFSRRGPPSLRDVMSFFVSAAWAKPRYVWADFAGEVEAISSSSPGYLAWIDAAGNAHEITISSASLKIDDDFYNVNTPWGQARFLAPDNWFDQNPIGPDEDGNKISFKNLEKTEVWKSFAADAYAAYYAIIEKLREQAEHECEFADGDCNCVLMGDPEDPCPKQNPQHLPAEEWNTGIPDTCRYCQRCGEKNSPGAFHKLVDAGASRCGCDCGYHSSDDDEMGAQWHVARGGAGEDACWCNCGRRHKGRVQSACQKICGTCHMFYAANTWEEAEAWGDPSENDHDAFSNGEGFDGTVDRCGCRCGHITSQTSNEKFHELRGRWGSSASQQGSSSACWCFCGRKHERQTDAKNFGWLVIDDAHCPGFCHCCSGVNDSGMDVGAWDSGLNAGIDLAKHAPSESGCGCKCGAISDAQGTMSLVEGEKKYHHFANGECTCSCSCEIHDPVADENCPNICSGCGCASVDNGHGLKKVKAETTYEDHAPNTPTSCGCKCGAAGAEYGFDGTEAGICDDAKYHAPHATACGCACGAVDGAECLPYEDYQAYHKGQNQEFACRCECGNAHPRLNGGQLCPLVCKTCGKPSDVTADGRDPMYHERHTGLCGCDCGNGGHPDVGWIAGNGDMPANMHVFSPTNCMCNCDTAHKGTPGSGTAWPGDCNCPRVCVACTNYVREGFSTVAPTGVKAAKKSDHSPVTVLAAADRPNRCGCACGKHKGGAYNDEDDCADGMELKHYHPKAAGSCRCWGDAGEGGRFHYQVYGALCPDVCHGYQYDRTAGTWTKRCNWKYNPSYQNGGMVRPDLVESADRLDHTPSVASHCGCQCGEYGASGYPPGDQRYLSYHVWRSGACGCLCTGGAEYANDGFKSAPFHSWNSGSCKCNCTLGNHHAVTNALCANICRGGCGGLVTDPNVTATKHLHTPKDDDCGCECGGYGYLAYLPLDATGLNELFHNGRNGCRCACGETHKHFDNHIGEDTPCPFVCKTCYYDINMRNNGSSIHTANDNCECECGHVRWPHDLNNGRVVDDATNSCATCGNDIVTRHRRYNCKGHDDHPCDFYEDGPSWEEGHAPNCGVAETAATEEPEQSKCNCGCHYYPGDGSTHDLGQGVCGTCGRNCGDESSPTSTDGVGGETGEPGGTLDDIL